MLALASTATPPGRMVLRIGAESSQSRPNLRTCLQLEIRSPAALLGGDAGVMGAVHLSISERMRARVTADRVGHPL